MTTRSKALRALVGLLLLAGVIGTSPASGQTPGQCTSGPPGSPEEAGPTDMTAVSGNRRLSVGLDGAGTVTVMKWPSPSYYDQIKYRTTDRGAPRMGALPNEGSFLGIAWRGPVPTPADPPPWTFRWLRTLPSTQHFADDDGDEVVTTYTKKDAGLTITVRDVVAAHEDALVRSVKVTRSSSSPVRNVRVIGFANFNPVVSKTAGSPTDDWCTEEKNDAGAQYASGSDAIVHTLGGVDGSTGAASSVAIAMGFSSHSEGHEVGADTYASNNAGVSAYDDAADGELGGTPTAAGQVDEALVDDLSLDGTHASTTLIYAAATGSQGAESILQHVRSEGAATVRADKVTWWKKWLATSKLPKGAPPQVEKLAKRALISIRQAADPGGLIVTSIATQPPMGLDWVRHGAYINEALDAAGYAGMVRAHDLRYAALQARASYTPPGGEATPPGNWTENLYADGVDGGSIPYEIDETGLGIWTLWRHYALTGDKTYLLNAEGGSVYEAIQRAAHYLVADSPVGCRDPQTGLQCAASEEDNPQSTQTLKGAEAAWLGLRTAVKAAKLRGTATALSNAQTWNSRRKELGRAIRKYFFRQKCGCYTHDYQTGGTFLWPVGFVPPGSRAAADQARVNWRHVARAVSGAARHGEYESRAILGNTYAWRDRPRTRRRLKAALEWVARVPTTSGTGVLGAAWAGYPRPRDKIQTMAGQPNVWNQAMFYVATLRTYGKTAWTD
jgi:hypothetical protein